MTFHTQNDKIQATYNAKTENALYTLAFEITPYVGKGAPPERVARCVAALAPMAVAPVATGPLLALPQLHDQHAPLTAPHLVRVIGLG